MKKICLMLVLALLLTGCGREPLPPESTATEASTVPIETTGEIPTTEPVTVDHSYRGEDWDSGYVITEDWGFFCPHMDTDVYPDLYVMGDLDSIYLLSRESIDPESISITLGTNLPYDVYVSEADWYFEYDKEVGYSEFDQYIYASYQNWDWKKHKEMNRTPVTDEEWKEAVAYDAEWMRMGEELEIILETGEGMPEFYIYGITFNVDYGAIRGTDRTEVINYMDVSWPGVSFRHEFGELRIHGGFADTFPEFPYQMAGIGFNQRMAEASSIDFEYIGEQESGFFGAFTASDEIALLRGYALDGSGEINDVRLVFQTDEGIVDMQWDENSKVWLDAGTVVEIWAKAGGPETFWSVRNERLYYCIEYECNGVRDVFMVSSHVIGNFNPFVLWALYFDETNLRSYYDDYWWAD